MRTAVDTNVLSALWSKETIAPKVAGELDQAHALGGVVVCGPVYAELLAHPLANPKFVDEFLADTNIVIDFDLGEDVWRQAAKGFAVYAERRRRSGGGSTTKRLLVDFIVAAHALLHADRLMTLDSSRYERDFAKLWLI